MIYSTLLFENETDMLYVKRQLYIKYNGMKYKSHFY